MCLPLHTVCRLILVGLLVICRFITIIDVPKQGFMERFSLTSGVLTLCGTHLRINVHVLFLAVFSIKTAVIRGYFCSL